MNSRDFESWWTTMVIDNPKKSVTIAFVAGAVFQFAVFMVAGMFV